MKPKTVGYSHTYRLGESDFEKIWHDIELEDGDDPRKALYQARKVVSDFHFESNKSEEKKAASIKADAIAEKNNTEWEEIKLNLSKIKFKEDAQEYLNTTKYSMLIEAKQIINLKKSKHEKK